MKKVIRVDGREIPLQTNGAVPLTYKKEFKRDFFADIQMMTRANVILKSYITLYGFLQKLQIVVYLNCIHGSKALNVSLLRALPGLLFHLLPLV